MSYERAIRLHLDNLIWAQASVVFDDLGLTVSDAVRIFLTKVVREKSLPSDWITPDAETLAAIEEARNQKKR